MMFLVFSMLGLAQAESLVLDLDIGSEDAFTIRVADVAGTGPMDWSYTSAEGSEVRLQVERESSSTDEVLRLWVEVEVGIRGEIDHRRSFLEIPLGEDHRMHSAMWSLRVAVQDTAEFSERERSNRSVRRRSSHRSRSTER